MKTKSIISFFIFLNSISVAFAGAPQSNPCAGKKTTVEATLLVHRNGKPSLVGSCLDGKLHGSVYVYFEDGSKETEATYERGERNGTLQVWYPNGKIKEKGIYEHGTYRKLWIWHDSGNRAAYGEYDAKGKIEYWISWDDKGNVEREIGAQRKEVVFP